MQHRQLALQCCANTEASNCSEQSPSKCRMCLAWQTSQTRSLPEASHRALPASLHLFLCVSFRLSFSLSAALRLFIVLFFFLSNLFFLILSFFVYFLFSMQIAVQSLSLWQSADIYFWFSSCYSFPQIKCGEWWSYIWSQMAIWDAFERYSNSNPSQLNCDDIWLHLDARHWVLHRA